MILFEYDDRFQAPEGWDEAFLTSALEKCLEHYGKRSLDMVFNLVDRDTMREINRQVYGRDYDTDTITLAYSAPEDQAVSADMYISYDQIRDNAARYGEPYLRELHRVLIHSLLHALGFDDRTPETKQNMHRREDACLETVLKR